MTTLGNAPGGAKLIASLTEAIADLSLLYAGSPDHRAIANLQVYIERVRPHIVEAVGAGTAEKLLEVFRGAVIGRKHEIQGTNGSPSAWHN